MAEGIARHFNKKKDVTFSSMGVGSRAGMPADPFAISVCQEKGIDISTHLSRELNMQELMKAEKIFCMDRGHLEYLKSLSLQISDKLVLLTDFPNKKMFSQDIPDPYTKSVGVFRKNRDMIIKNLERILPLL